jgi:outer membrane scaffolding protein for murein synthesis (MipA/OmpV family)
LFQLLSIVMIMSMVLMVSNTVYAAEEVACRLEAGVAPADVKISAGEKTIWTGKIEKGQKKTVQVPKGIVDLEARFFDQQAKKNQKLSRPLFTSMCAQSPIDVTMPEGG